MCLPCLVLRITVDFVGSVGLKAVDDKYVCNCVGKTVWSRQRKCQFLAHQLIDIATKTRAAPLRHWSDMLRLVQVHCKLLERLFWLEFPP